MNKVSSNLADYNFFCDQNNPEFQGAELCDDELFEFESLEELEALGDANPNSPSKYIESILLLIFIGMTFSGLTMLVCLCGCCFSVCGCRKSNNFKRLYGEEAYYSKHKKSVLFTYFLLGLFVFTMIILILLALARGTGKIDDAVNSAIDSPRDMVSLISGASSPLINLVVGLFGNVFIQFVADTRDRIDQVIGVEDVHLKFIEINDFFNLWSDENITFLVDESNNIEEFLNAGIDISEVVEPIQVQVTQLGEQADATIASLQSITSSFSGFDLESTEATLNSFETEVQGLQTDLTSLLVSLNGLIAVDDDMAQVNTALADILAGAFSVAEQTAFQTSSDDLTASAGAMDEGSDVVTQVSDTRDQILVLSDTVALLQTEISNVGDTLDQLDFTAARENLETLRQQVAGFDLTAAIDSVGELDVDLPNLAGVETLLQEMSDSASIILVVDELTVIAESLEAELFSFSTLDLMLRDLGTGREELINSFAVLDDLIVEFNTVTSELNESVIQERISEALLSLESELSTTLLDVDEALETVLQPLNDIETSISNSFSEFDDFSAALTNLQAELDTAAVDMQLSAEQETQLNAVVKQDFVDQAAIVADSANEVSALTVEQQYTCISDASTICFDNGVAAGCAQFDCTLPVDALTQIQSGLDESVGFSSDLVDPASSLSNALTELSTLDLSVEDTIVQLNSLEAEISGSDAVVEEMASELNDIQLELEDLLQIDLSTNIDPDVFDEVRANLDDILDSVNDGDFEKLIDFLVFEEDFYTFFTIDIPAALVALTEEKMQAELNSDDERGVTRMVDYIYIHLVALTTSMEKLGSVGLLDEIVSTREGMTDFLSFADLTRNLEVFNKNGPIFYLYELSLAIDGVEEAERRSINLDNDYVARFSNPMAEGFASDGDIIEYSEETGDGRSVCVTSDCLTNSIEYADQSILDDTAELDFQITTMISLPMLIPVFITLLAIAVFWFPSCGCFLGTCSGCCSVYLFLIFAGVFFPVSVVFGDVCREGEQLYAQYVEQSTGNLCYNNGEMINGMCTVTFNEILARAQIVSSGGELPFPEFVEIDFEALFLDTFVGCSAGESRANSDDSIGAIEGLYGVLGELSNASVIYLWDDLLDDDLGTEGNALNLSPSFKESLSAASRNAGVEFIDFFGDMNDALGCATLSKAYQSLKEPVCCEVMSATYYITAMMYTMAFAMLCCGMPAGFLAKTRIGNVKESRKQVGLFVAAGVEKVEQTPVGERLVPRVRNASTVIGDKFGRLRKASVLDAKKASSSAESIPVAAEFAEEVSQRNPVFEADEPPREERKISF